MRNIILMMPVSADGFTLIIGTPAGRPCGHSGTGRADYDPRPAGAPEECAALLA
jgi:hypothetical protein